MKCVKHLKNLGLAVFIGLLAGYAQPASASCGNPGDIVTVNVSVGNLGPGYFAFDFDNYGGNVPLCWCPTFGYAGCYGDISSITMPNYGSIYPKRLGVGDCNYNIWETGVFYSFPSSSFKSLNISIRIPNDAPCNGYGSFIVKVYKWYGYGYPTSSQPWNWGWYSTATGSFTVFGGNPPAAPTDIYLSSPNTYNCTWNTYVNSVPGAVQYQWTGYGTYYSNNNYGPQLPQNSGYNMCVRAKNSCGVWGAYYCEYMSTPPISGCSSYYRENPGSDDPAFFSSLEGISQLEAFPNPFREELTLRVPESLDGQVYRMVDASGRVVRQGRLSFGTHQVGTADMPNGLYVILTETHQIKLVKE